MLLKNATAKPTDRLGPGGRVLLCMGLLVMLWALLGVGAGCRRNGDGRARAPDARVRTVEVHVFRRAGDDKYGLVLNDGRIVLEPCYDYIYAFREGLASVELPASRGYIDVSGRLVIPLQLESAGSFSEGLAWTEVDGKGGYIDRTGRIVIEPEYDCVFEFSEGLAFVCKGDHLALPTGHLFRSIPLQIPMFSGDNKWYRICANSAPVLSYIGLFDHLLLLEVNNYRPPYQPLTYHVIQCCASRVEMAWSIHMRPSMRAHGDLMYAVPRKFDIGALEAVKGGISIALRLVFVGRHTCL